MKDINQDTFESEILNSNGKLIVDFWAPWCGPCKSLISILHEISDENDDINVYKINVDENADLCKQYNIRTIPTLLFFKDGKLINTMVGLSSKDDILSKF
jgi:thioredoxin 1